MDTSAHNQARARPDGEERIGQHADHSYRAARRLSCLLLAVLWQSQEQARSRCAGSR